MKKKLNTFKTELNKFIYNNGPFDNEYIFSEELEEHVKGVIVTYGIVLIL